MHINIVYDSTVVPHILPSYEVTPEIHRVE